MTDSLATVVITPDPLTSIINEDNFVLFAAKYYSNLQCVSIEEFNEDLQRFKYLKRLFKRYHQNNDLQERLILNHLIIIYNTFGIKAANQMMWFRIEPEYWYILKTFLIFLNYLEEEDRVEVPLDAHIINILRNL